MEEKEVTNEEKVLFDIVEYESGIAEYVADVYINDDPDYAIYTLSDLPNVEDVVYNVIHFHKGQNIDTFRNRVLKDLFLITLKLLMLKGKFTDDEIKMVKDWYFSAEPKYKVMN